MSPYDGFEQLGPSIFGAPRVTPTNETLFGTSVSISENGLNLAVGARGHDSAPSLLSTGGVFLYDYNGSTSSWDFTSMIEGDTDEKIGSFMALSGDGSRVTIRRNPNVSPNFVEVYDTSTGNRVGSPLTCDVKGSFVAVSHDGNRIAVSCELTGVNQGTVDIYDWNGVAWVSSGSINGASIGISNQGLFGWAVSFSKSGNRLAVSAPLFTSDGVNRRGIVKVFDYNIATSSWDQIGNDLLGSNEQDRFGLAIDLSGDGSVLVVGNSRLGTSGAGLVEAFELDNVSWVAKGDPVEGIDANDAFGIGVSTSFDGNAFAASSSLHDGRGQVRLMSFNGSGWDPAGEDIEGLDLGDRFGDGRNGISLSGDGSVVVAGSQFAVDTANNPTGRVRVFSLSQTILSIPSFFPSSEPSSLPSQLVVSTAAPSAAADKFSWYLERVGNATVVFDESADANEILLSYNVSLRTAIISVLDQDCITVIDEDVVGISQQTTPTSPTHGLLEVFLDLKEDAIKESPLWTDGSDTSTGYVDFCVRVDLRLNDGSSVNFDEHKFHVTIGLSAGFDISEVVDMDRDAAQEIFTEVVSTYEVQSCQCNESYICEEETLSQGDELYICVYTNVTNIEISAIEELDLLQGSLSISAVSDSTEDALTSVSLFGKLAVIRTQLRSVLFAETDPEDLRVTGICSITFSNDTETSSSGRRILQLEDGGVRNLQSASPPDDEDAAFNIEVGLSRDLADGNENNNSGSKGSRIVGMILTGFGLMVMAVFAVVVFRKKRVHDDDKKKDEQGPPNEVSVPSVMW